MSHPILRTQDTPRSHRVLVVVTVDVVERDAPFAYNIALSSPGCVLPCEPHGTDATVPCQPPDSALSVPSISPGSLAAIFVAALSASLGWLADIFVSVLALSPWPCVIVPHHPSIAPSLFPDIFSSVPSLSPGCFSAIFFPFSRFLSVGLLPFSLLFSMFLWVGLSPSSFLFSQFLSVRFLPFIPSFPQFLPVSLTPFFFLCLHFLWVGFLPLFDTFPPSSFRFLHLLRLPLFQSFDTRLTLSTGQRGQHDAQLSNTLPRNFFFTGHDGKNTHSSPDTLAIFIDPLDQSATSTQAFSPFFRWGVPPPPTPSGLPIAPT